MTHSLRVDLGERSYDIIIGTQLLKTAGAILAPVLRRPRVIIVTDETVALLHLPTLQKALAASGITYQQVILPPGEHTKRFVALEQLVDTLLGCAPDRLTTLVALGGGVIGDITGFAASILLRGIDFIQIPTTLLAQVDSSVGGKTGINTRQGKNLVGTFYQPRLVLADIDTLLTLPRRELLAGYAEVVKYGIICDAAFFAWLEKHGEEALAGNQEALTHLVLESCKTKAAIVGADEREAGVRALLNFGHTLGHALEAETGYSDKLLHGEAVAIGMVLAMRLSTHKGLCSPKEVKQLEQHLKAAGLPVLPCDVHIHSNPHDLIRHCYQDKKA